MGGDLNGLPVNSGFNKVEFCTSILDQFMGPNEKDQFWLTAVRISEEIGYDVLNIGVVSKYNGVPLWARTTMSAAWAELYLEKDYFNTDPIIAHMKVSNEQIVLDCDGPSHPSMPDKINEFRDDAKRFGYSHFRGFPFNWPTQSVYRVISFGLKSDQSRQETEEMIAKARILAEILALSARQKLGASTREQALAIAIQNGLINL